jgi:hypothetical protein
VASAVAEAQNVAADIVRARAGVKHAHEERWEKTIKEVKEGVNQKRDENKREYMKVVRRIKEVQQAIAKKYIERRQEQRKKEEEGKRDAQRKEAAKYRVTRSMRMHLNRGSEGASGDTEGMEENRAVGRAAAEWRWTKEKHSNPKQRG